MGGNLEGLGGGIVVCVWLGVERIGGGIEEADLEGLGGEIEEDVCVWEGVEGIGGGIEDVCV